MTQVADICLIAEGSYPFVSGGVSSWMHDMIRDLSDKTFHVVSLMPSARGYEPKYTLPPNVLTHDIVYLQELPQHIGATGARTDEIHERLRPLLHGLIDGVPFDQQSLSSLVRVLATYRGVLSQRVLLDDRAAWETLLAAYQQGYTHISFLDFFWTYRVMLSSLASTLIHPLPPARIYHTASTGFAGLMAARAKAETGSPVFITEHGIYTNERRIEIVAAEWLQQNRNGSMTVEQLSIDLRDMWMRFFQRIGQLCYDSCDRIVTLFAANQDAQMADGADRAKMMLIPNGVEVERFAKLPRALNDAPVIGLVGRVVPIKDVKGFLQAVHILSRSIPGLQAYIVGPVDEDPEYVNECHDLASYLGLDGIVRFTGLVDMNELFPKLDLVVLTSISEAQPLVLLEAGACGIPLVAPDVGACGEIIRGSVEEHPALGSGGIVTPLANPAATAQAVYALLSDRERYNAASDAIRKRVATYYPKSRQVDAYQQLYSQYLR